MVSRPNLRPTAVRLRTASALFAVLLLGGVAASCSSSSNSTSTSVTSNPAASHPAGLSPLRSTAWKDAATFAPPPNAGTISEPLTASPLDLAAYHYVESEYLASGTAYSFVPRTTPDNGRWTFGIGSSAPYATRIIVRRPADPAAFDGNVVVEWMNVSAGESAPDWEYMNPYLMDTGAAYIGVSVQALAVNGGTALLGNRLAGAGSGLRGSDPARYSTLHHPGDQYSLDMFAQIGRGIADEAPTILGGLHPTHVLAVGESQSAFYLTTYVNALQPLDPVYDGFFIHSRGGGAVPLNGTGANVKSAIDGSVRIRTNLDAPVFMFETQTDLIQLGYAAAQQPNTAHIHTWEVAGTSHADAYELGPAAGLLGCTTPVNTGPQHVVVQAAGRSFLIWADGGKTPPSPAPFTLASTDPARLALDSHGNVLGGVRTPAVDVPISTLSGAPPAHSTTLCGLFGSTVPFTPAQLTGLYSSPAHYVSLYTASLDKTIAGGYILPADRTALIAQARQVTFPSN